MKILFFAHETTWSGAPIQLLHLACWLKRNGHEVAVAIPGPHTPESGPVSRALGEAGVVTHPIVDLGAAPDFAEMEGLCVQSDVVVANTLVMWAPVRAASQRGVPVVWYIHESLVAEQLIASIPEISSSLDLADLLVMPTRRTAQLYAPRTTRPIEVVPYGIPDLEPGPASAKSAKIRFLLLGTYEPRKGQDLLVRAVEELDAGTRDRTIFQMAGRILDRPYYEALAIRAANLPDVKLLDALDHTKALALLAAVDALVCSSRDETMPVAILEAMSLGKAIITTEVGGIGEWLRDGENGLLVAADDSGALVTALKRCVKETGLLRSLGREARQTFLRNFSLDQLGRRFTALFERVRREKSR